MDAAPRGSRSDRRIAVWLGCTGFLLFLLPHHGHFKGSDEIAIYEMARSLYEHGDLAVPPLRHTEVGADGRRYSYFAPGQAVLVLPLFALARPLRAVLPEGVATALAGPPNQRGPYRFGGDLEGFLVGLFAPLSAVVLLVLFYVFERDLGVEPGAAVAVALALAVSTHLLVLSNYLLRHTTESVTLLGALLCFRRFGRGAGLGVLAAGSALASATILFRVPAAIAAPALAGYLASVLWRRGEPHADAGRRARVLAAIALPLAVALALHVLANEVRWGTWLASPMVGQQGRFNHPLWRGLLGLLLSPGSSVFVYSPLLLLAPFGLAALWPRDRAFVLTAAALAATWLLFYARFDGWSGLWSAPGPRYLFFLVPLLLLPLGLWLRAPDGPRRRRRIAAFAVAVATGVFVEGVSTVVRWGSVPGIAGYPVLSPDQSDFLFQVSRSPVVVMTKLLFGGGPIDSWLWNLWHGWPGFPGHPGVVAVLVLAWAAATAGCAAGLARALRAAGTEPA